RLRESPLVCSHAGSQYSSRSSVSFLCFFFFQAEDGIRDWSVTGVQTCALPISGGRLPAERAPATPAASRGPDRTFFCLAPRPPRSEERRVGKEGRSWWVADH